MTSFILNYLCKDPVCKYSYMDWSSTYEFVGGDSLIYSIVLLDPSTTMTALVLSVHSEEKQTAESIRLGVYHLPIE